MPYAPQAARNHHARLAARALARLSGRFGAPPNPVAAAALSSLLVLSLAGRLADADPRPLLKDLNSSVATPQVHSLQYKGLKFGVLKQKTHGPAAGLLNSKP